MPNRVIKESIRTSKGVNSLTDFQFRLWVYLITYVDDYGRGSADPELLKGFVFPRRKGVTEKAIADALADLANSGMIRLYKVDGDSFFCFPNWGLHQRIQTKKSRFPEPPSDNSDSQNSTVDHGESPPESESEYEYEIPPKSPSRGGRRFVQPTVEEVRAYCEERQNGIDAQSFVDFYTSKGWLVGKNPMKDWKAAVRTWERNRSGYSQPKVKVTVRDPYENYPVWD